MACNFQAKTGEKFAPSIGLRDEEFDINTMITTCNRAEKDAASQALGKEQQRCSQPL